MQLLQSLFCLQGFDNRKRFFTISFAIYLGFIVLSAALSDNYLFSLLVLTLLVTLNTFTTLRRLHDAKLNKNWLFAPATFAIVGLVVVFTGHSSSYWLLLLPMLISALLLTYPSKSGVNNKGQQYILGYFGPVDLQQYQQEQNTVKSQRIEPTFLADGQQSAHHEVVMETSINTQANTSSQFSASTRENTQDIGEIIRLKLFSHKNAKITFISVIALMLITISVSLITSFMQSKPEEKAIVVAVKVAIIRTNQLDMPDKFSLYQSEFNGIIIHWQADRIDDATLWSQQSAQGDSSCKEISFNKGKAIRTQQVLVEGKENYYASFSPLDSEELVQALAFRGNFSLCGYNFSLKGSQAALGKNASYADLLSY